MKGANRVQAGNAHDPSNSRSGGVFFLSQAFFGLHFDPGIVARSITSAENELDTDFSYAPILRAHCKSAWLPGLKSL